MTRTPIYIRCLFLYIVSSGLFVALRHLRSLTERSRQVSGITTLGRITQQPPASRLPLPPPTFRTAEARTAQYATSHETAM